MPVGRWQARGSTPQLQAIAPAHQPSGSGGLATSPKQEEAGKGTLLDSHGWVQEGSRRRRIEPPLVQTGNIKEPELQSKSLLQEMSRGS